MIAVEKLPVYLREDLLEPQAHVLRLTQEDQRQAQQARTEYLKLLAGVSLAVHPFSTLDSAIQSSKEAEKILKTTYQNLSDLQQEYQLPDKQQPLTAFKNQIPTLPLGSDFWWRHVEESLMTQEISSPQQQFICNIWLPYFYWRQQQQQTKNPKLKNIYLGLEHRAKEHIEHNQQFQSMQLQDIQNWQQWAQAMVQSFRRTSSAVEGRNGFLSQVYHNRRGLSQKRLRSLTTIHNFFLKRHDGSTAANRLYKNMEFPDLFEFLMGSVTQLPSARKREPRKPLLELLVPP